MRFFCLGEILEACATSADPLLKNRGSQELSDEETWRDFACVKVLLFAHIYGPLCYPTDSIALRLVQPFWLSGGKRARARLSDSELG